ncbi:MAG: hypothetical protein GY758_21250, partial [Fuerstiella sp.]|nr:hypothetical protein [Fuerstiella sp.]
MAKISPKTIATGGYLGPRLRPEFAGDGKQLWLMWERKSDHRGSTPKVWGDFIGRPLADDIWQPPAVIAKHYIDYHAVDPPAIKGGQLRLLASELPQKGLRKYQLLSVAPHAGEQLSREKWIGWNPVNLPVPEEQTPRQTIAVDGKMLKLFWADLHCHNGLTADAEGEPDEMHYYARDRAELDV